MSIWYSKPVKISIGLLLSHLTILLFVPSMDVRAWLSNAMILACVIAAIQASWAAARREKNSTRYVWQLLTAALLIWGLGQVCFMLFDLLLNLPPSAISPADILYLGWGAPVLLALLVRAQSSETSVVERALECAQVFIVVAVTYLSLCSSANQAAMDQVLMRTYDIENGVFALLFVARALIDRSYLRYLFRRLGIFFVLYAAAMALWSRLAIYYGVISGLAIDLMISGPFLFMAVAAGTWRAEPRPANSCEESTAKSALVNFSPLLIPFLPLLAFTMGMHYTRYQHVLGVVAMTVSFLCYAGRLTLVHRRQAQLVQVLEASDERFRQIARATNDAVWEWNIKSGEHWWGEGFGKLFGYEAQEIESSLDFWLTRIHPDDAGRILTGMYQFMKSGGEVRSSEYRFRKGDGKYAYVFDRSFLVRDAAGEPIRMIGAMADITERQTLAEQLRQAHKMETVGQLAGGVAHDINNLMMVILGYVKLLEDEHSHSETGSRYLKEIRKSAERGGSFTAQLLAFSRRQMLAPETIHLDEYLKEQLQALHAIVGQDVQLTLEHLAQDSTIRFDRAQLSQVLTSLAMNARDAMPAGGVLTLRTENVELAADSRDQAPTVTLGHYIVLSVIDTGIGMSEDLVGRIFEPFFTTKAQGKGIGLGLATVYGILKQSNAAIEVTSEVGRGTTFRIYIQVHRELPEARKQIPIHRESSRRETILLVDDEPGIREAIQKFLVSKGYEVFVATDGVEALDLARERSFDLLISDMVMPRMSGHELLAHFRELHPKAAALLISGYSGKFDDQALIGGAIGYLQKPFALPKLASKVRELLDRALSAEAGL